MKMLSWLGVAFTLVLIAASMTMNFQFMFYQGKTELNGYILGGVSAAFDGFKSLLPIFIVSAFAQSKYFKALIGSVVFSALILFAVISALGFSAGNRGAVNGNREAVTSAYTEAIKEVADREIRLNAIQTKRTPEAVIADMRAKEQNRRWRATNSCTNATASKSIDFCEGYFALQGEHANALTANKLRNELTAWRDKAAKLKGAGAGKPVDPQAGLIAKLIPGFEIADVQTALNVLIALLVEAVAAFGLYLSTGHGLIKKREKKQLQQDAQASDQKEAKDIVVITSSNPVLERKKRTRRPKAQTSVEQVIPERFNARNAHALVRSS